MTEEHLVAFAQVVEPLLTAFSGGKAVLGTLAVARETPLALHALSWERRLQASERALAWRIGHARKRLFVDVA